MRLLLIFVIAAVVLGCSKGSRNVAALAGAYTIEKYELQYYNGDAAKDSTFSISDVAEIGLFDNQSDERNRCVYSSAAVPRSWVDNGFGEPSDWYSDGGRGKTLTIEGFDLGQFVIYTVDRTGFKKYTWTHVQLTANGNIDYIETLFLKKQ